MKKGLVIICLSVILHSAYAQVMDSSDVIFVDSIVNTYELKYYITNWADTMEYNKEKAGEAYMPAKFIYRSPSGDSIVLDSIGVRYKGNSSYELSKDTPKKSFKFSFGEYKKDQTFFGLDRVNLNNNVLDPSQMREKISYDIARKYMPAPRAVYATLSIDGNRIGMYTQVEQIDELFIRRNFPADNSTIGNLYKAGDNGAALEYKDFNQKPYEAFYELKTNQKDNDWTGFINMLYKLNTSEDAKLVSSVKNYLDLDNCMRYLAWTIALSNFDSYTGSGRNYYIYDDPKTGRFFMIPWDNNMSFGLYLNGWNMVNNSPVSIKNINERPLTRRILGNDSLKVIYLAYLQELINGPLSDAAISAEADRLLGIIDSSVKAEPEANAFYPYQDFLDNIEIDKEYNDALSGKTIAYGIKSFPISRNEELAKQIEAGVTFERPAMQRASRRMESHYNPLAGNITIRFSGISATAPVNVAIFDVCGRIVARTVVGRSVNTATLFTDGLVPGVYSVRISSTGISQSSRVMITK